MKPFAGQARPVDRILALLDVLFRGAALIGEAYHPIRELAAGIPFDLGNHAARFTLGRRLVFEVMVELANVVGWAAFGALQRMRDSLLQDGTALEVDGVEGAFWLELLLGLGNANVGICAKPPLNN